jgi:serine/threonine-protein kinase
MSFVLPADTRLERFLGRGSIFEVGLLRRDGLPLICKRVRSRVLAEEVAQHAYAREAAVLEITSHPAVPSLIEIGEDVAGPYLLESWAEGLSLRALSDERRAADGRFDQREQQRLAQQAFRRLAQIHGLADEAGPLALVHGDLSPDHVIVTEDGDVVFIDFGQASGRGVPHPPSPRERGTMPYAAPERLRGEGSSQAGDVYALAACFAFLALGKTPCDEGASSGAALLVRLAEEGIDSQLLASLTDPPASASSAWRRALALAPDDRPTADQVAVWLASTGGRHDS